MGLFLLRHPCVNKCVGQQVPQPTHWPSSTQIKNIFSSTLTFLGGLHHMSLATKKHPEILQLIGSGMNHTTAQATWAPIVHLVRRLNWFSDNLLELLDRYNFLSRGLCMLSPCVWMKSNLKDYPPGQCEIYNKVYRRYTLYLLIWWVMMGSNVSIMGGRECSIITLSKSDPGQNNNNVV